MNPKATGGNPPKPTKAPSPKVPKPPKKAPIAYTYHPDGTFTMNIGTLLALMNVEERARLERELAKYQAPFPDEPGIVV